MEEYAVLTRVHAPGGQRKTDSILPFYDGKDAVRQYKRSTVVVRVFSAPAEAYVPPVRHASTGDCL